LGKYRRLTCRSIIIQPVGYVIALGVRHRFQTVLLKVAKSDEEKVSHLIVLNELVNLHTIASGGGIRERSEQVWVRGHGARHS